MEEELPPWLTKDFLKTTLEKDKKSDVIINSFDVERAVAKGNNYICDLFRVKINYSSTEEDNATTQVILKAPRSGGIYETIKKMGILEREPNMYKQILPRITEINKGKLFTPKLLGLSEDNGLVLEDLKFQGYEMKSRLDQLDFDHCLIALTTLAEFHAASVKLHEEDPELVETNGEEPFYTSALQEQSEQFIRPVYEAAAKEIKTWPGCEKYSEGLGGYGQSAAEILKEIVKPKQDEFKVLNHGDFWVTNMLFKYDNGKPVEVKLIDLQIGRYASPALDLHYFFAGSVQEEVRTTRFDELVQAYLKSLNAALERFGSKQRLQEEELRRVIDETEFFYLHTVVTLLPVILADVIIDMKEISEEDMKTAENNPLLKNIVSKRYKEIFPKRLADLEKKGWF